jgi:glycosyltransferase involved in cell wall biosynthesis
MIKTSIRLCYVVSSEMTVSAFLKDHIAAATAAGYQVTVVANAPNDTFLRGQGLSVAFYSVSIVRQISPWRDATALVALLRIFRSERFEIVHSISPKAGMLAMLAARIVGIPQCVHTFTGQVWITRKGLKRWILKQADCVLARLTTRALVDSPSQRDFLITEGVVAAKKTEVIGKGAICGVDGGRFKPDAEMRRKLRRDLGIPFNAPLLLYLGRLNRDKGVLDLAAAFVKLAKKIKTVELLFVGPDEGGMVDKLISICSDQRGKVHFVEYTQSPEHFMAAADIFCLPSYREGFGMSIIEAAAAGLPTVASRIYGITDAIIEGLTGMLHLPGDVDAIERQLRHLIMSPEQLQVLAAQARIRALEDFSKVESSQGLLDFYEKIRS